MGEDVAVDFQDMQAMARGVRARYAEMETERYGRAWTREEIMLGFVGDVGDLAKLVQGKEGVRPREDLDGALAHELADCLWSVLTLAHGYGVDLEAAFDKAIAGMDASLDEVPPEPTAVLDTARLARRFLATLEARDWDAWEALLSPDVVYEMPQTRERIIGRAAYREFNVSYQGEWHLSPKTVIGDGERAVAWFSWTLGEDSGDAQVFLEFGAGGSITKVTDFWPEPYNPPERPPDLVKRW